LAQQKYIKKLNTADNTVKTQYGIEQNTRQTSNCLQVKF